MEVLSPEVIVDSPSPQVPSPSPLHIHNTHLATCSASPACAAPPLPAQAHLLAQPAGLPSEPQAMEVQPELVCAADVSGAEAASEAPFALGAGTSAGDPSFAPDAGALFSSAAVGQLG